MCVCTMSFRQPYYVAIDTGIDNSKIKIAEKLRYIYLIKNVWTAQFPFHKNFEFQEKSNACYFNAKNPSKEYEAPKF